MKKALKFWGTRGSCSVSGPEYGHFGGNTCCLELRYDDTLLIIDAGTGIRPLGDTLLKERKINLFLSHTHWDHLIGFPFFAPLYQKDVEITIWAPEGQNRSCRKLFDDLFSQEFFPVPLVHVKAHLEFRVIREKQPVQIGPLTLDFHTTRHPGPTYCFKIKTPRQTINYVTDNDVGTNVSPSFISFHKGSDIFIHEAQYSTEEYPHKEGWGHSSLSNTIALVNQILPARWFVTHHDPKHTDADLRQFEAFAKGSSLPCPVEWIPDHYVLPLEGPG